METMMRGVQDEGSERRLRRRHLLGRVVLGAAALTLALAGTAEATLAARSRRLDGDDRFATARAVAEATFPTAPVVLLASGLSFGDALSASYLSGGIGAPLLLTGATLPPGTLDALDRMETERVLVIGGEAAVPDRVIETLESSGLLTSRVYGDSRFATARHVAETFAASSIGELDGGRAAIVVTGESFADALAAGPVSSSHGVPILLTTKSGLHPEARAALEELGIERVLVVGGAGAVSDATVEEIRSLGIGVRRIYGASRQETAVEVATYAADRLGYRMDRVLLARGDQFADALAAGTRGGWLTAPVVLVDGRDSLGTTARAFISDHVDTVVSIDVLGGVGAIADTVADDAVSAAQGR